jgi:hypothetical protein
MVMGRGFDCRFCRAPLAREARTCAACGEEVRWHWFKGSKQWPPRQLGSMPDAEVRGYGRAAIVPIVIFTAIAWAACAGMYAWAWDKAVRNRYPPEMRTKVEAILDEEGATPRLREIALVVHDEIITFRGLLEEALPLGTWFCVVAVTQLISVPLLFRLTAEPRWEPSPAPPADPGTNPPGPP